MAEDAFENDWMSEDDAEALGPSPSGEEEPRPWGLRPEEMPRADGERLPPRAREQALPEKDDDRFFDRWVVDKARALGNRAVRPPGVAQLKAAVRGFAEWRSLRHGPAAERQSLDDRALVAATEQNVKNAEAEAEQLEASAEEAEREAAKHEREAELADEKLGEFRPALRGSSWDFLLTLSANGVVFGVDIFVIRVALERIPSTPKEQWFTALLLGGGAVVVGDVLGWLAAAGSIRRDGSLRRPTWPTIVFVALMLIVSVLFFGQLGEFREFGLKVTAEQDGTNLGNPTFFTLAQILFLFASAVVSFAYVGRRSGRELQLSHQAAIGERDGSRAEAKRFREKAKGRRRAAAEAPALRAAAEERIAARERIAEGLAAHDIKQGEYLENLVDPEYMRERAGVESGIHFWQYGSGGPKPVPPTLWIVLAVLATLASGAGAYFFVKSVPSAVFVGVIVALAGAMLLAGRNGREEEAAAQERHRRYVAEFIAAARESGETATDIDRLVPLRPGGGPNGAANGNGNGRANPFDGLTRRELLDKLEQMQRIFEEEAGRDE